MNQLKSKSQSGQIVVVLLLIMLVGLGIGLAVTQKSITDVTTSTQNEQSSRAFSAAQAGLERALLNPAPSVNISKNELDNQSSASVTVNADQPAAGTGVALEFPGVKPDLDGQFWLSKLDLTTQYTQSTVDVYFGDPTAAEPAAAEIIAISKNGANYVATRSFYDSAGTTRTSQNGFSNCPFPNPSAITTTSGTLRSFKCLVSNLTLPAGTPIMVRVKLLYITNGQSAVVSPKGFPCGGLPACELPPQASIFTSVGTSGQSQKTLQVFKSKEVPYLFDYALFSAGDILK